MHIKLEISVLLFWSLILYAVTADSTIDSIGNLPICAQVCITIAAAQCHCKLTDFQCSCTCNSFISNIETCVGESCAASHLQEVLSLMSTTCDAFKTSTTTSHTSTTTTTAQSSSLSIGRSQSSTVSRVESSTTGGNSTPKPGASSAPTTTMNNDLPNPSWPSSIIGPACVPISAMPNSSYPMRNNWTNGIIWVNGTWRNSSCLQNSTNGGPQQVSANMAAASWTSLCSVLLGGIMVVAFLVA